MAVTSAQVQELYVGLLGRAADKAGLDYWVGELNKAGTTLTLENVRANFVAEQAEYKAIYGDLSRADTVVQVYSNLFGRAPDAAGLTYWSTGAGASVNVDQLVVAFINAASTSDKQALTNKVVVSEVYSSTVGANFVKADAAAIVSGVSSNANTVSAALNKLTDGSLSGVAVPTGVAQLQAQAAAVKAQADYQTAKVADLNKLAADVAAFGKANDMASVSKATADVTKNAQGQFADLTSNTDGVGVAKELADARGVLVNSTAQLQVNADVAAKALSDARTNLTLAENGYAAKATAYEAAFKAAAAAKAPAEQAVTDAKLVLSTATLVATADAKAALVAALKATGVDTLQAVAFDNAGNAGTAVDAVYAQLTTGTAQVKAQIDSALQSFGSYAPVKALATQQADHLAKAAALTSATVALEAGAADVEEAAFIAAVPGAVNTAKAVEASKALDALAAQYKAIVDGNAALTAAVNKAGTDLGNVKNLVEITAGLTFNADTVPGVAGTGGVNDLFYFGNTGGTGLTGAKDAIITNAGSVGIKGVDSIYLGEGFVKGTATISATNKIVGGNDGVKEVFFFQKGNDTYVVAEAKSFGSSTVDKFLDAGAVAADHADVAIIQLVGVGIENVSFANGVVTIA